MKIFEAIKNKVIETKNKYNAWAEKHPIGRKVVCGTAFVGGAAITAAIAGAALYHKKDDVPEVETVEIPMLEEAKQEEPEVCETDYDALEKEETAKLWETDKEDWQKVIDVSKELNNIGDEYDGYHIYKLGDEIKVARTTDNGSSYYYHEDIEPEAKEEPSEPETTEEA